MTGIFPPASELAALLDDAIRYDRSGVSARARACYVEITDRAREHPAIAAEAWWRLANVQRLQSQWDDAIASARAGAELARAHALPDVEADALNIEATVWTARGDVPRAWRLFERMLELATKPLTRAKALQNLGMLAAEDRRFEEAERLFNESRDVYRLIDDARGEACSLVNLGRLQAERGDPALAKETLEAAVRQSRLAGDLELHAGALLNLGNALGELGELAEAEERITSAYGQFTIADIPQQRVRCLLQLATLAMGRREPEAARVCLDHALKVAERAELPRELRLIRELLARIDAG
ncbi:MAG TPA: tetratricopeptide repeat protein [Gemmatimonadaceae bacterium]|nr:tetratricopeptide repeat protein [Gemmatimonadaceae bacterium]